MRVPFQSLIAASADRRKRTWTRSLCRSLVIIFSIAAPAANADTIENLAFTGSAVCESPFAFQVCTPGSMGPLTGTYTLDVTTQQIIGPWSFSSPFFSHSSSDPGAFGAVIDGVMNGGISYDDVEFSIGSASFDEVLVFGFTGANALLELGPISTPAPVDVVISGICQNISGMAGCEPDVNITGATSLAPSAPEPGTGTLIGISAVAGALLWLRRPGSKAAFPQS